MSQHAETSPSQLERIILCPGSVGLCKTVPKLPTSKYAAEGTLLHTYTEQHLEMWPAVPEIEYEQIDHEAAVHDSINYLRSEIDFEEPGLVRFQELKVCMKEFEGVYGTLDFGSISPSALHIADFKYGRGIAVRAYDNSQLLAYLDGFLWMLEQKFPNLYQLAQTVPWYIHIIQPRIDNYDKEQVFARDLVQFNALIDRTMRLAYAPNAPFNPGETQCRWCDAGGVCRVRLDQVKAIQTSALMAFADLQENRADMETIQSILEKRGEVDSAFDAIEKFIFLELAKGGEVPRFKLVRGRSNRTWAAGVDFNKLTSEFPELDERADQLIDTKLRGPAQIEKLLPAGRRKDLEALVIKPEGKLTIAPIDSPKEAVIINDPQKAFADFIDE